MTELQLSMVMVGFVNLSGALIMVIAFIIIVLKAGLGTGLAAVFAVLMLFLSVVVPFAGQVFLLRADVFFPMVGVEFATKLFLWGGAIANLLSALTVLVVALLRWSRPDNTPGVRSDVSHI